jgi:TatD DNase family protein
MQLFDSHAHLTDPAFNSDRKTLIENVLPQDGIAGVAEIGCSPEEWQETLTLADEYRGFIFPVLGVHPENASKFTAAQETLLSTLIQRACAVGEIGLDYTCLEVADKDLQQHLFMQMLRLASLHEKTAVLHVRRTAEDYSVYDDTFALLKQYFTAPKKRPYAGVLHCFCARYEEAEKALDEGFLLGINGCFTYKKNEYIREAVKKAGPSYLVLETDCPYLSPQGKRGQRNDPSNLALLAPFVADYLGVEPETLAEITTRNTKALYGLE